MELHLNTKDDSLEDLKNAIELLQKVVKQRNGLTEETVMPITQLKSTPKKEAQTPVFEIVPPTQHIAPASPIKKTIKAEIDEKELYKKVNKEAGVDLRTDEEEDKDLEKGDFKIELY